MRIHLALFAASLTLALLAPPPERRLDRPPLPTRQAEAKPKLRTTERTRFFIDGAEVTKAEFLAAEGLTVDEVALDGDEILTLKATTKGKP